MAGGFGTRLRPLTMTIPKPMVPIANSPMMEHIVNLLKKYDIKDIVSVLYFHPDRITSYFEDGAKFGINMNYVLAEADYGTAGAVRNAAEHLNERFIITSADVLTDFDISKAIEFHEQKQSKATILLTRVPKPLQFGIVITDDDGRIVRFLEKPSWGQVFSDTINTGIYILEPEVLDLIPYREEFDFSKDLFPMMLREKMPIYGYISEGYWRDVGNLNEYQKGQNDTLKGKVSMQFKGVTKDQLTMGNNCKISPKAQFTDVVILGDNVEIGDHAEIRNSVIGDNTRIGMGAKIRGTTIWHNTIIGDFVEITDAVICNECEIGDSALILENVFISEKCSIGKDAQLNSNIKLWPEKRVEDGATLSRSLVQEEKWTRELFTDARITGLSNIEIHPEFGAKLGAAIGMTFGKKINFLASRDPDNVSRIMKRSIVAGLSSVGVNVNDLQTTSIPQTRQELRTRRYEGGLHVRRSPRMPNFTDIIIFNKEGRDIAISRTKSIERYFFGEDIKRVAPDKVGAINYPERTNEIYINRFLESLNGDVIRDRKFRLLMDYSFGLTSPIFPSILGKLNCEALSLHNYVDFTRFSPEPIFGEEGPPDETGMIMRSLGYELGFRMEAGGEKIALIDERGAWYSGMRLLSIVLKLFLETNRHREPYKIGISIVATDEVEQIAKDYNVEIFRIKNSHSAMMEATREENVLFVGGIYGGYIFSDFLFASDGMYTVGKILEMLATTEYRISKLDEELPRRYQHIVHVPCPWEMKGRVMRRALAHSEGQKRQLVEGVKIFLDTGDVLMLPTKEKESFSVFGESRQYETAQSLAKKYANLITQWQEEA